MRIAILGCGSIGRQHLAALRQLGHSDLAAIDPNPEARKAVERFVGRKHCFAAFDEANADAVIVCTPTAQHRADILAAYQRGMHVICEKPVSHMMEGGDAVLDAQGDRLGIVACPMRFHPGMVQLKKDVTERTLGAVFAGEVWYRQRLDTWRPGTDWRACYSSHRDQGGGLFFDRIHELDYLRWLFGEPKVLRATLATVGDFDMDVEEMASAILSYEVEGESVVVMLDLDCVTPGYQCGAAFLAPGGIIKQNFAPVVDGQVQRIGFAVAELEQMKHWLACLAGDDEPCQTLRDGYAAVQTAVACYISAEQGKAVRIGQGPPTPEGS